MHERLDVLRHRLRDDALRRGVNPRDVDLLLCDVVGEPLSYVFAHGDLVIDPAPLEALVERRHDGEPIQYIRKKTDFYGHEFYVDDRVLIPRPETELLVEAAIERAPPGARVADIGTGSGCIAISIEKERPDLRVVGLDLSLDALVVAKRNRDRLVSGVHLATSDLLGSCRANAFDVIVSNPPYIAEEELEALASEVRDHEPRIALTPGATGLETIERIFRSAGGALLLIEIGFGQEWPIRELAMIHGIHVETIIDDLAGIPRVVVARRSS